MTETRSIAEADPVNAAMFDSDVDHYARRFEYLANRRDQLLDKLRFGVLGLNGASIIALMSALGGKGSAATWLGFTEQTAQASAAAFIAGAIAAGVAITLEANLHRTEAGDCEARRSTAIRLNALYKAKLNAKNFDQAGAVMKEYHALPLVDFQFSKAAIVFQNCAAGAWLFGVLMPLSSLLGWR